jgi:hypothetical protein
MTIAAPRVKRSDFVSPLPLCVISPGPLLLHSAGRQAFLFQISEPSEQPCTHMVRRLLFLFSPIWCVVKKVAS